MPRKQSKRKGTTGKESAESAKFLRVINLAAQMMSMDLRDKDAVISRLLRVVTTGLGADGGLVALPDRKLKVVTFPYRYQLPVSIKKLRAPFSTNTRSLLLKNGRSHFISRYPSHSSRLPELVKAGATQLFSHPLPFRGRVVGAVWVVWRKAGERPAPQEVKYLEIMSRAIAAVLETTRLIGEEQKQLAHLQALREIAIKISAELNLDRLLTLIIRKGMELLSLESGGVETWDERRRRYVVTHVVNMPKKLKGLLIPPDAGITGRIARSRRVSVVEDYRKLPRQVPEIRAQGYTAMIGAPIRVGGMLYGNLILNTCQPGRHFEQGEKDLFALLAEHASVAVENARLLQARREYESRLHQLSHGIIFAQEEERRRIARELHDDYGQAVTAIKLRLDMLNRKWGKVLPAGLQEEIAQIEQILSDTMREIRQLITDLRPTMLDDLGLIPTLRWRVGRFQEETGIATRLVLPKKWDRLSSQLETTIYRVVQEGLNNVARHSAATRAQVRLEKTNGVVSAWVEDNGVGFDVESAMEEVKESVGLMGIEERVTLLGGKAEISSRIGKGTRIWVELPVRPGN